MGILQQWRDKAYDEKANKGDLKRLWSEYFAKEKDIYAELLKNPDEVVTGTVKELADKYNVDLMTMTGFLDGINDSLKEANPIEEMEEDTVVNLGFGSMTWKSGNRSLTRRSGRSSTRSRKPAERW